MGENPAEVVIGISPAFGLQLFQTTGGRNLLEVLKCLMDGIEASGVDVSHR